MLGAVVTVLAGFIATALLTAIYYRWAQQRSIVDSPSHRSSHSVDTVHGAGVVFVIIYALIAIEMMRAGEPPLPWYFVAPVVIGVVGLLDDFYSLGVRVRMLCYSAVLAVVVVASDFSFMGTDATVLRWFCAGLAMFP